jgi:phosphoribosylaminoimidazole (AIR) synthetase
MTITASLKANENTSDVLRSVFAELNDHYSKPVRTVIEIMGWETPDAIGDVTGGSRQKRLRTLTPVRVLIDPDADPARVVDLLRRITEWYEADGPSIGYVPDPF